ncbi:hypothetical protein SERLA73DRAFT_175069 [Serpula lacrymans var. lacrymans S7.3]|uniref:Uncharacterized protein n=2 Tax=Serpula lacrymans var. lacrymans TaxID=341189 RepID=F8PKL5_SERL3|nr:uncharacterized protein SERLADRAFT_457024 [Serpula lacrymans var. lacrymans S7.9]EGO03562.1 hypothetical protein SERLA73DRAFT_175069 [Serpula lacrymans var. lacrymans S7.3]EGO29380.1 hypothetical protein SERLADRAFT_457024 [Serpula lacrymans var. lacrymans S7.9]
MGRTPLHCAILGIDGEDELELSTQSPISASTSTNANTGTCEAIVSLLLAHHEIHVDLEDDNGWTPLMLARSFKAIAVVKLLEAYITRRTRENRTRWMNRAPLTGTTIVGHQTLHRTNIARPLLCPIQRIITYVHNDDQDHYLSESPIILPENPPSPD